MSTESVRKAYDTIPYVTTAEEWRERWIEEAKENEILQGRIAHLEHEKELADKEIEELRKQLS